jgi:hypothetical protein
MKYILKKKWHPSQVEEVGYEFEEINTVYGEKFHSLKYFFTDYKSDYKYRPQYILPHEIALLVDAGYLVKQEECTTKDEEGYVHFHYGEEGVCKRNKYYHFEGYFKKERTREDIQNDIAELKKSGKCVCINTVNPGCPHEKLTSELMDITFGNTDPTLDLWTTEPPEGTKYWALVCTDIDIRIRECKFKNDVFDRINIGNCNCHRTQKSAEEALKRLLEK